MSYRYRVPLKNPQPDIGHFLDVMSGKVFPEHVPVSEFLIDNAVMKPIMEDLLGLRWIDMSGLFDFFGGQFNFANYPISQINAWLDNMIEFWYRMGYHFIRIEMSLPLPSVSYFTADTAENNKDHIRTWMGMDEGPIENWEDFEKYHWPKITDETFYIHEYICNHLPDGMGFMACHAGGVYEHTARLLGFRRLCLYFYDNPELVIAISNRVGELILEYTKNLVELSGLSAIFQGEDLGFKTQTLISPHHIRQYFLPWHKKFAQLAHDKGKFYFLHSCGRVDELMDDFIDYVKIDGKHSFENQSAPVIDAKRLYGDKIAILGGVDVDKLATLRPDDLRCYVRSIIEECGRDGRFSIGSGNSIPSFVPVENYLTMLDESLK